MPGVLLDDDIILIRIIVIIIIIIIILLRRYLSACFTSVLIVINIYALLQDRVLGLSYEPPMQWLRMLKGLRRILQMAGKRWLQGNPGAVVNVLVKSASSPLDHDALFAEGSRVEFAHLHRPVICRGQCQREGCGEGKELTMRRRRTQRLEMHTIKRSRISAPSIWPLKPASMTWKSADGS